MAISLVPTLAAAALAVAALAASSTEARAGLPACASLPNPVYLQIGDTQQPLIKELGRDRKSVV